MEPDGPKVVADQEVVLPDVLAERAPDVVKETGDTSGQIARYLQIRYDADHTWVTGVGEVENTMSWRFTGRVSGEDVLAEYIRNMEE